MEKVTTETPAQEAEENEVEVNEVTASPPSLAQLYAMFHPIQELAFYVTCPMRVVIFRELYMRLERRFPSQTQQHSGKCSLRKCFRNVLKSFLLIKFCQHELVRIRNSAEIAALYEGSTISRPPVWCRHHIISYAWSLEAAWHGMKNVQNSRILGSSIFWLWFCRKLQQIWKFKYFLRTVSVYYTEKVRRKYLRASGLGNPRIQLKNRSFSFCFW